MQISPRIINPVTIGVISATVILGSTSIFFLSSQTSQSSVRASDTPKANKITALGRLEPEGETIKLSVTESSGSTRVSKILVKEGDQVKSGQVVAILDSRDRRASALEQAQEDVKVAESRLAQVEAGAKSGEIQAQKANISRLESELSGQIATQAATVASSEAELRNAEAEYQRYQSIYQDGAISASSRDSRLLTLQTAQARLREAKASQERTIATVKDQLKEAKETLNRIAEVRPVDVQVARAEVDRAIASVNQAEAELELSYVRAPRDGRILKIHTKSGEVISDQKKGIAEIGNTETMYAVAEVYQSDIKQVKMGQAAIITSNAFTGELKGVVDQIGWQIAKQDVLGTDPAADQDARVVEVKVRLSPEASKVVKNLTNLQLKVAIAL
ncbi:ABC exporter membrane fusion protein, DevB family [Synechococcus sp. PCC 7502]|uniref:ABC exporter membrane fusion protein n=1 Tax=Synechococcus sp. PCC 7502 TaxID=1173263 RepID=UPI00029FE3DF|nr:ABC exporter membrane fusion protein [Synechococcus sp. PCC 7502]AFY72982.1 ABC exporter membrane fusion protein, DevB family [Synechococcus sp. PCC 7502]